MTLVAAFLICWTPVELIILVRLTGKMARLCEHSCRFLDKVSRSLVWLSSTVNAILYIHSGGFKSKIKKRARQYVSENPARTSMLHSQIHSTQRESLLDSGKEGRNNHRSTGVDNSREMMYQKIAYITNIM